MALQDLTPQLRTRLSRMERAVGLFVIIAAGLLVFGFGYYIYTTAERKGWFKTKAPFFTFTDRATGLKVGDPVKLMGLDVGQITKIEPMEPENFQYNMYIEFELKDPYYGYIWTDGSRAKVATADLLGKRELEVTKGTGGYPAYVFNPLKSFSLSEAQNLPASSKTNLQLGEEIHADGTNFFLRALTPVSSLDFNELARHKIQYFMALDVSQKENSMTGVWNDHTGAYEKFKTKGYWLLSDESAAVTERLEALVGQVEKALPDILSLTNQLITVLSNSASLTSNLNVVALNARPVISNLAAATLNLDHPGALGEWLLPTNLNHQLEGALGSATATLDTANTNLAALAGNLERSLDNIANLTSNLNSQVQSNTNLVSAIDQAIVHTDELVQGLKHHWLLRSAFKTKPTNAPPAKAVKPAVSPKARQP
jgi:ABC-type transporter Mla subunit MlaD